MRVLVAEDDAGLRSVLERGLRRGGYTVDAVADGGRALRYLGAYAYEAAVLDWRMPGTSGLEVVQELRRRGSSVPVLMLSALDATTSRVEGLDAGADDYLVKPFEFAELLARLRALQRRPSEARPPGLALGDLHLDPASRVARRGGEELTLTAREWAILEVLLRRHPAVVPRRSIAVQVWDDEAGAVGTNTIDVHVGRLRVKLAQSTVRIETVRGVGYKLADR